MRRTGQPQHGGQIAGRRAHLLLAVVELRRPAAVLPMVAMRLLAFADARGAGAEHHGDTVRSEPGDRRVHRRADRRQRHGDQGVVASAQRDRQVGEVRQSARHDTQRQRPTGGDALGERDTPRRVGGEQRLRHRFDVAPQRAGQAQMVQEHRAHGVTGADWMSSR